MQDSGHDAVATRLGNRKVQGEIGLDKTFHVVSGQGHLLEDGANVGKLRWRGVAGGLRDRVMLEQSARLEEFVRVGKLIDGPEPSVEAAPSGLGSAWLREKSSA